MSLDLYKDFLIACVGASASFIGLLFVALTVVLDRGNRGSEMEFTDRRLAESSFTALANIFFVSIAGLIPGNNIGFVALIAVIFGLLNVWHLLRRFRQTNERGTFTQTRSNVYWIIYSFIIYGAQAVFAIRLIRDPNSKTDLNSMMGILLALFGLALVRTWDLIGFRSNDRK
jgi:hypothetical protein